MSFEPILLAPEVETEGIYPYRRVWRTSWIETSALFMLVASLYIANSLGALPTTPGSPLIRATIALAPLTLWLLASYRSELRAPQPRRGLVGVLILGSLVASGIAIPLEENVFVPDRWLPAQGFFGRALGYMFTIGFTGEFLKYATLRYTVWPDHFQQRLDGIAYALAVSLGYASAMNLRFALSTDATVVATALRIASITFSQLAIGAVMGFFLAELIIGRVPIFWLASGLGIASLLSGLYYAFRGIAIVGGLNALGTGASPERGLALSYGLVIIVFLIMAFIIENADTRMETATGRRQPL